MIGNKTCNIISLQKSPSSTKITEGFVNDCGFKFGHISEAYLKASQTSMMKLKAVYYFRKKAPS